MRDHLKGITKRKFARRLLDGNQHTSDCCTYHNGK
jgi:hypothetical protein